MGLVELVPHHRESQQLVDLVVPVAVVVVVVAAVGLVVGLVDQHH